MERDENAQMSGFSIYHIRASVEYMQHKRKQAPSTPRALLKL